MAPIRGDGFEGKSSCGICPNLEYLVNAGAGGRRRAGIAQWADISVQWNNCIEPKGVCCLDIFVREILAKESLTTPQPVKGKASYI